MPRRAKELSAIEVKRLASGVHPVGGVPGLYLQVTEGGGRSWLLRTPIGGKRREIGLGSYPEVSLKEARLSASENKAKIRQGINPIEERKQLRKFLLDQEK
ncbi:MAG: Arm DNA-binding domain-containing protein, partial [Paracoccaceae bacterium]